MATRPARPLLAPTDRRQADGWSCGKVAALTCLELVGWTGPGWTDSLLPATPIDGTDARSFEAALRKHGYPVLSGEMDAADLAYHTARGRPVACLVQLDGCGHWVTVWRATARRVRWHCPATGLRDATPAAFRRDWWDWDRLGVDYRCFGVAVGPGRKG